MDTSLERPDDATTADREELVGRIADELAERLVAGEMIDLAAYQRQYPEVAEELPDVYASVRAFQGLQDSGSETLPAMEEQESGDTALAAMGDRLGDFKLLREIARGGMGIVYEAEQISLGRRVALKILPFAAVLDRQKLKRFKNEVHAAASLDHPNIVHVFSVGSERGIHFYAMQYIEGRSLGEVIDEVHSRRALSSRPGTEFQSVLRTVAIWTRDVARALHYAHEMGVVHRDVKPSNLLVDDHGSIWVTDFGLARSTVDESMTLTGEGDLVGTVAYMSPEQAGGDRLTLDHRTDIYSLGVTLYEMLTRKKPFGQQSRTDVLYRVLHEEPPAPRAIDRGIPREMETVVLTAMAKDPADRYQTAGEMADDLERFLRDEPVRAQRTTLARRTAKWVRRNRALSAAAALAVACLLVLAVGGWWSAYALRTSSEKLRAALDVKDRHLYVSHVRLAGDALNDPNYPNVEQARELLGEHIPDDGEVDQRGFAWHFLWQRADPAERTLVGHVGEVWCVTWSPDGTIIASAGEDGTLKFWDPTTGKCRRTLQAHDGPARYVRYAPDGKRLASVGEDGVLRVWDAARGKPLLEKLAHDPGCYVLAWSPDGETIATCGDETTIKLWDAATLEPAGKLTGHTFAVMHLTFSRDGGVLISGGVDQTVRLWDVKRLASTESLPLVQAARCLAISQDGRRLAASDRMGYVSIWDTSTRKRLKHRQLHDQPIYGIDFHCDGKLIAAASKDRLIRILDVESLNVVRVLPGHARRVYSIAYSPDGEFLVSADRDGLIKLWRAGADQRGYSEVVMPGDHDRIYDLELGPQGHQIFFTAGGSAKLVEAIGREARQLKGQNVCGQMHVAISDDRRWLAAGGQTWVPITPDQATWARFDRADVHQADMDADGDFDLLAAFGPRRRLVWQENLGRDGFALPVVAKLSATHRTEEYMIDAGANARREVLRLWAVAEGTAITVFKNAARGCYRPAELRFGHSWGADLLCAADVNGDGRYELLAKRHAQNDIVLLRESEDNVYRRDSDFSIPSNGIDREWMAAADIDADGHEDLAIAFAGAGRIAWYRNRGNGDFESARVLAENLSEPNLIAAEDVDADGRVDLLTASNGEVVWFRNLGEERFAAPQRFTAPLEECGFLRPLGTTVTVWDLQTGRVSAAFHGHAQFTHALAFAPDGRELATVGCDAVVRFWRLPDGEFLHAVPSLGGEGDDVEYAPSGPLVAITAGDHVLLWDRTARKPTAILRGHESTVKEVCFSPDGRTLATLSHDLTVRLWDPQTGASLRMLIGHAARPLAACFSADGRTLATADQSGVVKLWDVELGQDLLTLQRCPGEVRSIRFRDESTLVAAVHSEEHESSLILCTWEVGSD